MLSIRAMSFSCPALTYEFSSHTLVELEQTLYCKLERKLKFAMCSILMCEDV